MSLEAHQSHVFAEGSRKDILCLSTQHHFVLHTGKIMGYESDRFRFKPQLCHLLTP